VVEHPTVNRMVISSSLMGGAYYFQTRI